MLNRYLTLIVIMATLGFSYYGLVWSLFYSHQDLPEINPSSPSLRARFGTVMWHSSIDYGYSHVYCYYPKSNAQYQDKGGEYLIKRVSSLDDCSDFLGTVTFQEDPWVSESQKIWWPNTRADKLAVDNYEPLKAL